MTFIQLMASLLIYLLIACTNGNYNVGIFNNVIEKVKYAMTYNMDVESTYSRVIECINNNFTYKLFESEENSIYEIPQENTITDESGISTSEPMNEEVANEQEIIEEQNNENTITEVTEIKAEGGAEEDTSSYSQMEIDANEINSKYVFIKPLEGQVSSRFGIRNPTSPNVPKYHTGIDVATAVGTEIKASIAGEVKLVSSVGDYGKHVKILTDDDIITLYAHCSEINVKEGDIVYQGQIIALSGNTGNSTGPHLHFEIQKSGRVVNPEYILEF